MTQTDFLQELHQFITEHLYFISTGGTFTDTHSQDKQEYESHDPDGDYERIVIRVNLIP